MSASMGKEIAFAKKCFYGIGRSFHYLSNNASRTCYRETKMLENSGIAQPYACFSLTAIHNIRKLVPNEPDYEPDDFLGIESDIQHQQSKAHIDTNLSDDVKNLFHEKDVNIKTSEKVIQTNFGHIRRDTDNKTQARRRYKQGESTAESNLHSQVTAMFSLFSDQNTKPVKPSIDSVNNGLLKTMTTADKGIGYQPMTRRERHQKNRELTSSLDEKQNGHGLKSVTEHYSHDMPNKTLESANQQRNIELDYFGNYLDNKQASPNFKPYTQSPGSSEKSGHMPFNKTSETGNISDLSCVDTEYFGSYLSEQRPVQNKVLSDTNDVRSEDVHKETEMPSYFDECFLDSESKYLKSNHSEEKLKGHQDITDVKDKTNFQIDTKPQTSDEHSLRMNEDLSESRNIFSPAVQRSGKRRTSQGTSLLEESEPMDSSDMIVKQKTKSPPVAFNVEKPETAYDVVMKMRLEKDGRVTSVENNKAAPEIVPAIGERLDSHGFRILTDQVQDWRKVPRHAVTKLLKDSIIFERGDIIALNKPYGLASHGGPSISASVGQYLSDLAKEIDPTGELDTLHLIHRLDKETTGVMLLAKTPQMAWRLHRMFRKRQVIKKYWAITKGVPNPVQGVIDIPMVEGTVEGRYRMVLKPKSTEETRLVMKKSVIKPFEAITHYRVLDSSNSAALVECQPESGIKHQIRAHLAFGLNTPVLGDHKYSHLTKIAPQRLYPETLQKLGIRQSKVRTLPMHLHASVLILPEFENGRNIIISSRLPKHFVRNMQRLKIKPPK